MAVGGGVITGGGRSHLLFGYDLGISGGATSMPSFLKKFFRSVYRKMQDDSGHDNAYCKFDSHLLTLFFSLPGGAGVFLLCLSHYKELRR